MLSTKMLSSARLASRYSFNPSHALRASKFPNRIPQSKAIVPKSNAMLLSSTASPVAAPINKLTKRFTKKELATGGLVAALIAQSFFGSESDYYEYRFVIKRDIDPDDLASFYGSDEFMELFAMFPVIKNIMMAGGEFDDDGVVHTYGFPGTLLVSMAFTDETNEETGQVDWFNKRERFKDVFLGYKMWDSVLNFGFHTLDDGKIEVYHHGEYFVGRLPVVSLLMKFTFQIQARIVAWATEHHLNHRAFTAETDEEFEIEALSRENHVLYMLKYHFWKDFKAMIGITSDKSEEEDDTSFLSKKVEDEDEERKVLPIKHKLTLRKVIDDIHMDKQLDVKESGILDSISDDLNAYQKAHKVALQRHNTLRVTKRMSNRPIA